MSYEIGRVELEQLLETAALAGAKKALQGIGLHDEAAGNDVRELRGLLDAWRTAKKETGKTAVQWLTKTFLLVLVAGIFVKSGLDLDILTRK